MLTEGEPRQNHGEHVVEELNMEEEHADDVVATLVHPPEVHERVYAGSERSVEPTASLADEFWGSLGHIRFPFRGFDISQMPFRPLFGNQLETEDSILGKEHVLLENVHVFDPPASVELRSGMITEEILIQRPAHDGTISVRRKRSGQHADISKRALQGFV